MRDPTQQAREAAERIAEPIRVLAGWSKIGSKYLLTVSQIEQTLLAFRQATLEEAMIVLAKECADEDPDDLYTGRAERLAAIRRLASPTPSTNAQEEPHG